MNEEFLKYPKIFSIGHEECKEIFSDPEDTIVIQEKMDGANFRFYITSKGQIVFGSRGTQDIKEEGNWKRCMQFIRHKLMEAEMSKFKQLRNKIFYGECMVQHTVAYDWSRVPPFFGFDVYDLKKKKFIDYEDALAIYSQLGITFVPFIKSCKVSELPKEWNDDIIPPSNYYSGQAEGIVLKNYKKQLFTKWVTSKFKEVNKEVFGGSKKHAIDDTERLVCIYCTNQRIEKNVFKLIDDGFKFDMEMMHTLPKAVIKDIMAENWEEICFSRWSVSFKEINKKISIRCAAVLKQMIANSALK